VSDTYAVLHDPRGLIEAELPLDRAPHEALVDAVLAWKDPDLAPCDYEQIGLQLTGHARAVAADVRRHAAALPRATAAAPSPKLSSAKPKAASPNRSRAPPAASGTAPGSWRRSTRAWTASPNLRWPPCSPLGDCSHGLCKLYPGRTCQGPE
jgi:hypothetical protein